MDLIKAGQDVSMTTVEIAERTGKRHDHVLRDASKMLDELYSHNGKGGHPKFGGTYLDAQNKRRPCLILPKKEVMVLVTGYSIPLRAKVIDRLEELENKTADPMAVLNDPAAMRGLLLTYSEKVIELQPKADALDRIATADGSMCITDAAKHLQIRPKDLFLYLSQNRWIYKRAGGKTWLGYQDRVQQGRLEHKVTTHINNEGVERINEQVRITPKGLAILAKIFETETA